MRASPYQRRVAAALDQYESLSGRRPLTDLFDPDDDAVQRQYAEFTRQRFPIELGANNADRIGVQAGFKPMLRQLVTPRSWPAERAWLERAGLSWHQVPDPVREDGRDGRLDLAPAGEGTVRLVVLAGRDLDALAEGAEIEEQLVAAAPVDPTAGLSARLGRLLGYPACCVEAFCDAERLEPNHAPIARAARRSDRFEVLLNNVSLTVFHFVGWFPCRYDCAVSLAFAGQVAERLPDGPHAAARSLLRLPRLYLDDRRQLIFDGAASGDSIRFNDVFTPYAIDHRKDHAGLEWVFWMDVVARVRVGDDLRVRPGSLEVRRAGSVIDRVPVDDDAVFLPFGAVA